MRSGGLARVRREHIHEPSAQDHTRKATWITPGGFSTSQRILFQENAMHAAKPPETQEDPRKLHGSRSW